MSTTLGQIAGTRPGPALVVGGGPSVLDALDRVLPRKWATVLSANGHAFKLEGVKPDFIVAKDHIHTTTKQRMEPQLRKHSVPIISRQYWADYRMLEWNLPGNSGLTAIAVAACLGATEIHVIGVDCYTQGSYFHDLHARTIGRGRSMDNLMVKVSKIREQVDPVPVAVYSGPLEGTWGPVSLRSTTPLIDAQRLLPSHYVEAHAQMRLPFEPRAKIPPGARFFVSSRELENLHVRNSVNVLGT